MERVRERDRCHRRLILSLMIGGLNLDKGRDKGKDREYYINIRRRGKSIIGYWLMSTLSPHWIADSLIRIYYYQVIITMRISITTI